MADLFMLSVHAMTDSMMMAATEKHKCRHWYQDLHKPFHEPDRAIFQNNHVALAKHEHVYCLTSASSSNMFYLILFESD